MTALRWLRSLAGRLLPRRRRNRVFLALLLSAIAAAWCYWYRPWEAHYHGWPASRWVGYVEGSFEGSYRTPKHRLEEIFGSAIVASIPKWLDSFLEPPDCRPEDVDFEPILVELLHRPNIDVRAYAARTLSTNGVAGFRQALPVLVDVCGRHPDATYRGHAASCIRESVVKYREEAETAMSSLRDCHKVETDQYVRNCIVESMRDIDPGAKGLPPLIYNYSSLDWGTQGFRYVWLTRAWTGYYSGPWVSVTDNTAPSGTNQALVQTDRSPQTAVRESFYAEPARNIEMRVSIKAIRGDVEQGGGLVWRHQDLRNYYAAGINPRDGSLRLVRRADDKLVQLGCKDGLKLSAREWYTLSVKHVDDKIECSLDGTKYLEAGDSSIPWSGFFGMWTRADAETHFDGLRVIDYGE